MNYANIKYNDISNGPGVRTSVYVSGCPHHCKGCFNQETWDFNFGKEFTDEVIEEILDKSSEDHIKGLTVLGGEPLAPDNQSDVLKLVRVFRERYPKKTIWLFTGYLYEDLKSVYKTQITELIFKYLDVVVDGPFIEHDKDYALGFRGSSNQRIIDVKKTKEKKMIVFDENQFNKEMRSEWN